VLLALTAQLPHAIAQQPKPLAGVALRCCALVEAPVIVRDALSSDTGNFSGLGILYLQELQARLGFTCSSLTGYAAPRPELEGFSGFIKYMGECAVDGDSSQCDCDIGVAGFAENPERTSLVDFVAAFTYDGFSVVQMASAVADSPSSAVFFLAPFSNRVWAGIASIVVFIMFITMLDRGFRPPAGGEHPADNSVIRKVRRFLLSNKLLRLARYAFFHVGMSPSRLRRAQSC
jgi:hypothetical protein